MDSKAVKDSARPDASKWWAGLGISAMSRAAIRRWRLLLIATWGLLGIALFAWNSIGRAEDPVVEPAEAGVIVPYPGASAEDVEAQVVKTLEGALYGMSRIQFVESEALPNLAFFHLKFEDGTPMDVMVERIRGLIQGRRSDLPSEVKDPSVFKYSTGTFTAQMVLAVVGNRSDRVLTEHAERLRDEFAAVPGVASVELRAASERAVRVKLDPVKLASFHIGVDEVVRQLRSTNVRIPAGTLEVGTLVTLLELNHELRGVESVMAVPVGTASDGIVTRTVTLGEVAEVTESTAPATRKFMYRDLPAVALELRFRSGQDAVSIGERVRDRLAELQPAASEGVLLVVAYDQPAWVDESLGKFVRSLLEGIVLVMAVVTFGIGWRAALAVSFAVPLSIAGAVLGLFICGFTLDQISLAGLIVALGLLVDDAVVVVESVQLMRNRGLSATRAAVVGTARVFWANNGTTAVACAAFVPLFFMGGGVGSFIRGLPAAVVFALLTSLVVAQLVTPWIARLLVRPSTNTPELPDDVAFDLRADRAERGEHEVNPLLRRFKDAYARHVHTVVAHPFIVVTLASVALGVAVWAIPQIGVQFFPKSEKPALFVSVAMPRGTSLKATSETVSRVVRRIQEDPDVLDVSAMIGGSYPQVLVSRAPRLPTTDLGDVLVRTRKTADTEALARRLRQGLAHISGANVTVEEIYTGPGVAHPIAIRIVGDDYAQLREYAQDVKGMLRAQPGTLNVDDSLSSTIPVTSIALDARRAFALGATPASVGSTLRAIYGNDKVSEYLENGKTVQILLEPPAQPPRPLEQVEATPVSTPDGRLLPIAAVGDARVNRSFAVLKRRNTRRVVDVVADVDGRTLPSAVLAAVNPQLEAKEWKVGYGFEYSGVEAETGQSFYNLAVAALGALTCIFVFVMLMFNSFTASVATLAATPYALIGAIGGLAIAGEPFGFMAFLGLIALIGVYVNHKIYFVDRFLELMRRGEPLERAIEGAGIDRLRPVILTALTAVLGLVPLTLGGGSIWTGFGSVGIFGLIASIPLSLILLPAFVVIAYKIRAVVRPNAAADFSKTRLFGRVTAYEPKPLASLTAARESSSLIGK